MKLVIQRVEKARVFRESDKKTVGEIGRGLFVLVGFKKGDSEKDVEDLADKLAKLRVMGDDRQKMNLSVKDTDAQILVVSQFTLYADTNGGNRPSFVEAESPVRAKELYELFVGKLKEKGIKVETGSFGDYMQIESLLDGPVTIIYE
ncbi:MAG: D-tyrosyl-tRNA(Tyr) deacylase, D-tyrosyl-tRNA(Tyr) deacylase [Microgenomates group bacterium GW2011_GWC1_41_20]|uniref:D-aminoacyl-tRNA deacylase n=4 Tax=Candidatus Woeseibacteriota TaxID=1752722 RepID=A0A0G0U989_9BACT|nr:MAG: D-tyrosyl-tRNA(Tyr) deacylase [Candidatus Woesebacteria bacterium GW2011_GWB1_40_12]KKR56050.1 MAG: D-tyrosyl-tRNA(Tyr) deacylase [Candidatus Woesebacteria bacterium GW2011_GWF1_40_24]KKS00811.1 MAG: D-tyrosyl-tRNA(Tyr) deacylase, D-tyrosyl-tRNA(Tyr) deacylase [Microgenomates group bacterium GW2011_GWC1_41_20]KKS05750.1 MAG: D-tyrosyl-tRNA(Tyr) deacylase [Candidatus Woesebacteria bacterium GW2011_GWE1_41_24]OGM84848.1 MAG: D-tyrosyl-tRNA(Tyr) deacylase [Candidatus Woesebacteria bacteriu